MTAKPTKTVSDSESILSVIARPGDANTNGTIFGGRLMEWMDMIAAICARRHTQLRVATVSVSELHFYRAVRVGDVVTLEARMTCTFQSSLETEVCLFAENTFKAERQLAASAFFKIVGLNEALEPVRIPQLVPETDIEKRRWQEARARRQHDLKQKEYGKL
jgi:acyl-CoA hydrolase